MRSHAQKYEIKMGRVTAAPELGIDGEGAIGGKARPSAACCAAGETVAPTSQTPSCHPDFNGIHAKESVLAHSTVDGLSSHVPAAPTAQHMLGEAPA